MKRHLLYKGFLVATLLMFATACGSGGGGKVSVPKPEPDGIGPAGGTVTSSDGLAKAEVPSGALSSHVVISIESPSIPPGGMLGKAYLFKPEGTGFLLPVKITITFDDAVLPFGVSETDLYLAKWLNNQWEKVPDSVNDPGANTVSGTTTGFSIYGVAAPEVTSKLDVVLDEKNRVTELISPETGGIITTGSDGITFKLSFPPNALKESLKISLTPISHIGSLPIGTANIAAVHLSPSGLVLDIPATLSFELPAGSAGSPIILGYLVQDSGQGPEFLPVTKTGDTVNLNLSHFSVAGLVATSLEEFKDMVLEKYYGEGGIKEMLESVTDCDQSLKDLAGQIMYLFRQIDLGHVFEFPARDCIYKSSEHQCSSLKDLVAAGKYSLLKKITEIFKEKDAMCPDDPSKEIDALSCIGYANRWSDLGVLTDSFYGKSVDGYGKTLFSDKNCGLYTFEITPNSAPIYMSIGSTIGLQAVARDRDGNILSNRPVIWQGLNDDIVSGTAEGNYVLLNALRQGELDITAFDKMSADAMSGPVEGRNIDTAHVRVGGLVELTPSKVTLIPPEIQLFEATLRSPTGNNITPPTGWSWSSSDTSVAAVDSTGEYRAPVHAVGPGIAIITATEGSTGLSRTARVLVGYKVSVTPPDACLYEFEEKQLTATVLDLDDEPVPDIGPYDIVWYTPDSSVVSVNIEGLALAKSPGQVQIDATYKNSTGFSKIFVPKFPDDYSFTPVLDLIDPRINDDREPVGDIYQKVVDAIEWCGLDLPPPDVFPRETVLHMNNNNQVTATIDFGDGEGAVGVFFDMNTCKDITFRYPGSGRQEVVTINDNGLILGAAEVRGPCYDKQVSLGLTIPGEDIVAFIYDPVSDSFTDVLSTIDWVYPIDMNNHQEVIGGIEKCDFEWYEPTQTWWWTGEAFYFLNGMSGFTRLTDVYDYQPVFTFEPSAINDKGLIVGFERGISAKGAIYKQGNYIIPDLPAGSDFIDINNWDDILVEGLPTPENPEGYFMMHLCPLEE